LTAYQNSAYGESYQAFVQRVRSVDESVGGKSLALTEAVARYLFKLMAYKDEYEVARLHADSAFHSKISELFEGNFKLHYHLAPPLLAKRNAKGELQKQQFGPATLTVFKILARLKGLRGTALDIFGKTAERRQERALITQYRASIDEIVIALAGTGGEAHDKERYAMALEIARQPEQIKGFGHVKERNIKAALQNWDSQLTRFRNPQAAQKAA
jgi:indolepyruvate ferredoxin oxidoreductase